MSRASVGNTDGRRRTAVLGVVGLILMAVIGLSYREWRQYNRANVENAQTRAIIDLTDRLLFRLLDAEAGQRGYLLTGEDRYLQPYNESIQAIPGDLADLRNRLSSRAKEAGAAARLEQLVAEKLAELRQTIELRRAGGAAPAITVAQSDQGKRVMDEIRALCAGIQRRETASEVEASQSGEAAAGAALLVTVAGSMLLLFVFAFGLEPFASSAPQAQLRSWPLRYGAAIVVVAAAALFRAALTPLMGGRSMPFTLFFPAVWFAAWFGGLRPGALSVALSALAGDYFFAEPTKTVIIRYHDDQIALLMLIIVGFGMALLSRSQQRAVARAMQAETAERNERLRFETTLTSIGDAVIATDAEGRVTFANHIALSLTRWAAADAAGRPIAEVFRIVNEFTRASVDSPVARVLREGSIVGLANHTVLIAKDGAEIPIDDSAAPIRDTSGALRGTVLVFRDITARRGAERTSQRLAAIVESSEDAIIGKDLNGIVTSWNKGAERMLGYSADEMIGQPVSLLAVPGRPDEMPEILQRIRRGEPVEQLQTVRRTKSGALIHVSIAVSPIRGPNGEITGASKIMRDITAQVRAQELVAEHRERLATVMKHLPVGVGVIDTAGRVVIANPVWKKLLRGDIPSIDPEEAARWRAASPDGRALLPAEYPGQRALRGEEVLPGVDFLRRDDDGVERWIRVSAVPLRDPDGQLAGALAMLQDVSQERRAEAHKAELLAKERALEAEKALRETEAELARVTRALSLGELATSIAHEVNQPLVGVVTNAEAGLRWLGADPPNLGEAKESLQMIAEDGERAGEIIRRLRAFLTKRPPEAAPLDINQVARDAVALTRAELAKRSVAIRLDISDGLPPVRGDRVQLQQVVLNLILNAADAMADTAESKELIISSRQSAEGGVSVAVRDSGAGIDARDLPRIFDAFFTTKPAGIGMGLSISRSILEAHGGRIWAEANEGPGLTVQFTLPAAEAEGITSAIGDRS